MASGTPASVDEVVEWLRKRFDPEAAGGLRVAFQYVLSGPAGGTFHARVDEGRLDVAHGAYPHPDVVFRLPAADFFDVLAGRANADMLFMAGRIAIEGDLSLALKMRKLFRGPRS